MIALLAITVPFVMPSIKLISAALAVTPSKMFSSAVVKVTPSIILNSDAVAVTPSKMFNSAISRGNIVVPFIDKASVSNVPSTSTLPDISKDAAIS